MPCLVVPDPLLADGPLPDGPGLVSRDHVAAGKADVLAEVAMSLAEDWTMPARSPYVFYAADFAEEGRERRNLLKELVQAVTTLPCVLGENLTEGTGVQAEILKRVCGGAVVLADISDDSPNVYIEIGAARASGTVLSVLRRGPQGRPAFMLRDHEVVHYADDADLLGNVFRLTYPYRRVLLTPCPV